MTRALVGGIALIVLLGAGLLAARELGLGFVAIQPNEKAIVLRLGAYHRELTPGAHFVWPVVERVEIEKTTLRRLEFGYTTRANADGSPLEEAETDSPALEYEDDLEERRMLTTDDSMLEVEFVLKYSVRDVRAFRLEIENAEGLLRDVAAAAVRAVVARRPFNAVLTDARAAIEADAQEEIRRVLGRYEIGVRVERIELQDVSVPAAVREAYGDVNQAAKDQDRIITEAEGYREQVLPRARGEASEIKAAAVAYRESKVLEAQGEANRFTALLTEYRKAPEVTRSRLYIEALEDVFPRMDKIIMEQGSAGNVLPYLPLGQRRPGAQGGERRGESQP